MTAPAARPGAMPGPSVPVSAPCRACGLDTGPERVRIREMMLGLREVFDYRRCAACGSLSIVDIPTDLERFYPPSYYANNPRRKVHDDPFWRRMAVRALIAERAFGSSSALLPVARRLAAIPRGYREIRGLIEDGGLASFDDAVLDVGCGAAPVRLVIFREIGFRCVLGVDPFLDGDRVFHGVRIHKGYLSDVSGPFRLIMFHHSLEHVVDPLETLRQAAARLEPDGRCLVRTPITDSWLWRRYGTDWVELDAPRHIVVFSLRGFERLAARAGFAIVRITWESSDWEFIASEQYRRDIGMYEPDSWFEEPSGNGFDQATIESFREAARRLNAAGDAGRAAIWLRRTADATA